MGLPPIPASEDERLTYLLKRHHRGHAHAEHREVVFPRIDVCLDLEAWGAKLEGDPQAVRFRVDGREHRFRRERLGAMFYKDDGSGDTEPRWITVWVEEA